MPGILYIVSTPIGNLGDVTLRALEILRSVTVVLAEDTRHARKLLDRYEITTATTAYHEHNEARAVPQVLGRLERGEQVALISDAGTPLLSDPGQRLVDAVAAAGAQVVPVPGASALLSALVASGIDAARFTYLGFLARKGAERTAELAIVVRSALTVVIYESPNRIAATLGDLVRAGAGSRTGAVARELTKMHEEVRRGTLEELAAYYEETPARGEIVLVVAGRPPDAAPDDATLLDEARRLRAAGATVRDVVQTLMDRYGAPRNLAYRLAQEAPAAPEPDPADI